MGVKSNNPTESYYNYFGNSGVKAWKPYEAPEGLGASGGVINDYESGGKYYRTHMFQTPGSFVVNNLSKDAALPDKVDILLVGGGGGGSSDSGGGGGGGGVLIYSDEPTWSPTGAAYDVTAQTYPITVGSGGAGTRSSSQWGKAFRDEPVSWNTGYTTKSAGRGSYGYPGQNSVFSTPTGAVYTAGYGGGGGSNHQWADGAGNAAGLAGGPGGGSGGGAGAGPGAPHSGGNAGPGGGYAGGSAPGGEHGGGGGGAGGTGGRTPHPWYANQASSPGGSGKQCVILGPQLADPIAYWGGGGAGCRGPGPGVSPSPDGTGGIGGGGAGGGKNNLWPTSGLGGAGYSYGGDGWPVPAGGPDPGQQWDCGDRSFDLGGGRWTGGGGGGTGGPVNGQFPSGRQQFVGARGGNGGEGTCVIRYQISNLQYHGVKATGGYTSQYNNKTIHVFNRSGTFTNVSGAPLDCEVVTIAGGGGGGVDQGGGGGAGGMLITPTITVGPAAPNAVTVTIGVGGVGQRWEPNVQVHPNWSAQNGSDDQQMAQRGGNSSFGPTLVAMGGGGGGQRGNNSGTNPTSAMGQPGGSGGGLGAAPGTPTDPAPTNPQIVGWNDPTAPGQGYPGGLGLNNNGGGGGGGAGGAGSNYNPPPTSPTDMNNLIGGTGGIGKKLPATFQDPQMGWGAPGPSPGRWFCGGGGGGNYSVHPGQMPAIKNPSGGGGPRGAGGATPWSGGGNGGGNNADSGLSGANGWENTGGGGGGGAGTSNAIQGGKGGPGIVFVAYDNPAPAYN